MKTIEATTPLPHAEHAFGTREGAFNTVEDNVRQLTERYGPIAYMRQIHGTKLAYASKPGVYEETDALYTDRTDLSLAVSTADCVPVLLSSPRAVAVVHNGWRGLAGGLLPQTIRTLCEEFDMAPAHIFMHIGPCIRQENYEVEDHFTEDFAEQFFKPAKKKGHLLLDLVGVAIEQARDEGIPTENIYDSGFNTFTENQFFSYRRSKMEGEDKNVQLSIVSRKRD